MSRQWAWNIPVLNKNEEGKTEEIEIPISLNFELILIEIFTDWNSLFLLVPKSQSSTFVSPSIFTFEYHRVPLTRFWVPLTVKLRLPFSHPKIQINISFLSLTNKFYPRSKRWLFFLNSFIRSSALFCESSSSCFRKKRCNFLLKKKTSWRTETYKGVHFLTLWSVSSPKCVYISKIEDFFIFFLLFSFSFLSHPSTFFPPINC